MTGHGTPFLNPETHELGERPPDGGKASLAGPHEHGAGHVEHGLRAPADSTCCERSAFVFVARLLYINQADAHVLV